MWECFPDGTQRTLRVVDGCGWVVHLRLINPPTTTTTFGRYVRDQQPGLWSCRQDSVITNGGFEANAPARWTTVHAGSTGLPSWTVSAGTVRFGGFNASGWCQNQNCPAEGSSMLRLCSGTVTQTVYTVVGRTYVLGLNTASHGSSNGHATARLTVSAGQTSLTTRTLQQPNNNGWNLHWNYTQLFFTATSQASTVTLHGLAGCMLVDNITVIDTANPACNGVPTSIPPAFADCGQTFQGYTSGATGGGENFTFVASTAPIQLTVSTCGSGFDTWLRVVGPQGVVVGSCDDCGNCGVQTVLSVTLPTVGRYTIMLTGYGGAVGAFTLSTSCATAAPVPIPLACGHNYSGVTTHASLVQNFSLVVPAGPIQQITLSTCGSAFDTMLGVYDHLGNTVSFCDDCGPCGTRAILQLTLQPGTYVAVRCRPAAAALPLLARDRPVCLCGSVSRAHGLLVAVLCLAHLSALSLCCF